MSKPLILSLATSFLLAVGLIVISNQKDSENTNADENQVKAQRSSSSRVSKTIKSTENKWGKLTDDALPYKERLKLARQIDKNIGSKEIDYLFKALKHRPTVGNEENWWMVMNEIMEQMRRKGVASERLGKELTSLVTDSSQPEIVRDYAVQHLSLWITPASAGIPSESSPEVVEKALSAISATITNPSIAHTSIPGTAIMALTAASSELSKDTMFPIWKKLDPAMTLMLKGEISVPLSTRTSIIQGIAMRSSKSHLPLIQSMARDEKINPSMRLSSIAALGIYHSESDREYLTTLAQGETRYRYAAKSALKKLQQHK